MSSIFLMPASGEIYDFLEEVALEMVQQFRLPYAEAVARINEHWRDRELVNNGEIILHELPYYWAMIIYFREVFDWSQDADRSAWRPKPPPDKDSPSWTV